MKESWGKLMEFIFVKTKEFEEFEEQLKDSISSIKKNGIQLILGSLLFYIVLCAMIILL